jgi:hypothetical protein
MTTIIYRDDNDEEMSISLNSELSDVGFNNLQLKSLHEPDFYRKVADAFNNPSRHFSCTIPLKLSPAFVLDLLVARYLHR